MAESMGNAFPAGTRLSESSQAAKHFNLFSSDLCRQLLGQRFSPVVLYLGAPQVMAARDQHMKSGRRADRIGVPREAVSIEPDAPGQKCSTFIDSYRLLFQTVPSRIIISFMLFQDTRGSRVPPAHDSPWRLQAANGECTEEHPGLLNPKEASLPTTGDSFLLWSLSQKPCPHPGSLKICFPKCTPRGAFAVARFQCDHFAHLSLAPLRLRRTGSRRTLRYR